MRFFLIFSLLPAFLLLVFRPLISTQTGFQRLELDTQLDSTTNRFLQQLIQYFEDPNRAKQAGVIADCGFMSYYVSKSSLSKGFLPFTTALCTGQEREISFWLWLNSTSKFQTDLTMLLQDITSLVEDKSWSFRGTSAFTETGVERQQVVIKFISSKKRRTRLFELESNIKHFVFGFTKINHSVAMNESTKSWSSNKANFGFSTINHKVVGWQSRENSHSSSNHWGILLNNWVKKFALS